MSILLQLWMTHFAVTEQTFTVYELNEFDRDSPAFLELSRQTVNRVDPNTGDHIKALGDQVPFTNKVLSIHFLLELIS